MSYAAKDTRYDTMVYNRCGTGGLKLPAMSFGLWHNFGYGSTYSNAREMVLGAFDMGITHLIWPTIMGRRRDPQRRPLERFCRAIWENTGMN